MQGKNFPPGSVNLKTASGEEISATRDKFIQLQSSAGSAYIVLFDVKARILNQLINYNIINNCRPPMEWSMLWTQSSR